MKRLAALSFFAAGAMFCGILDSARAGQPALAALFLVFMLLNLFFGVLDLGATRRA